MNKKVYMHAINCEDNSFDEQFNVLKKIISSQALLSGRLQGQEASFGYNGYDYISLCDFERRNLYPVDKEGYNAYNGYIKYGLSLAFNKENTDVIIPNYLDYVESGGKKMRELGLSIKRYSDYLDEVQVKDRLSLDNLEYITFPTHAYKRNILYLSRMDKYELLKYQLNELKRYLYSNNYYVDIYDIETEKKLDDKSLKKIML